MFEVQKLLKNAGFDPGPLDGIRGRKTIAAVKAFQASKKLTVDGIVGPKTLKALKGANGIKKVDAKISTSPDYTPWLDEGYRVFGLHEIRNKRSIWDWMKLGGWNLGDPSKNPWCGGYVLTCIAQTLPEESTPTNPFLALNWKKFGIECEPQVGSVLVFWRGSPKSWKGHVGFYVGEDSTHYYVLGGNQSNAVTVSRIAKNRLRTDGSRWPSTAMKPQGIKKYMTPDEAKNFKVTTNEA